MQKLFINFILIFSFAINCYSQNNLINTQKSDTAVSIFDNLYLYQDINKRTELLKDINSKILIYQNKLQRSQKIQKNLKLKSKTYLKIYGISLKSIFLLKNNISSPLLFFLSSNSFNQMNFRFNYFKLLISYIKTLHNYIKILNKELQTNKKLLNSYKTTLNLYMNTGQNEKAYIDSNLLILLKQTSILQQKSNQIRISINNTYQGFQMIANSIKNTNISTVKTTSKFKLDCYPLNEPVIISSFGEHSHPYLKNVKVRNDGIDLFSSVDTLPKAVLNGIVVKILNIPHLGKSVIIKHFSYYTVYSNLNKVYAKENDSIKSGYVIGTLSKKTSKYNFPCLNFQIWNQTKKLNPNIYLNLN